MNFNQSEKYYQRAQKVMAGGVSSEFRKFSHPFPLFYKEAKGATITDVDNNTYLDFTLSQGPAILGHSHPEVLECIEAYSKQGQIFAGQHKLELELAEKIVELIPCAEQVRFSVSGSEADHTALRLAKAYTKRNKILRFEGHYHGWFDNVCYGISAPSSEAIGSREEPNVFAWSSGIPEQNSDTLVIPWNDLELLEQTIKKYKNELAAVITEPVMCNNGCIPPEANYLQKMRELCTENGIVLIFDEVITGFRLNLGGAQTHFNVTPDLAVFGKAMANGYPISCLVGKRELMQMITESKVIHAGTLNSQNACVAAAYSTITILEKDHIINDLHEKGQYLMQGLKKGAEACQNTIHIQGAGPMFHMAFTELDKIKEYRDMFHVNGAAYGQFVKGMQERGIRLIGRGLWYVSAAHTRDDLDRAIQASEDTLKGIQV